MKKLTVALSMAVSLFAMTALAGEWTGYISESKCGAAHADGSEKSISCVKECVKKGAKPVFVSEEKKVLTITNPEEVMDYLGQKVKVTGSLENDSLIVGGVEAAE